MVPGTHYLYPHRTGAYRAAVCCAGQAFCCMLVRYRIHGAVMKLAIALILSGIAAAQEAAHQHPAPAAAPIPLQPLAQQVRQLEDALNYLGQALPAADQRRINEAIGNADEAAAVAQLQAVLDPYVLLSVDINPESRVKVEQGAAKPELVEAGTRLFLVKVANNGHVTAPLNVESPNSGNVYVRSSGDPAPPMQLTRARFGRALGRYLALPAAAHAPAPHRAGAGIRDPRNL